MEVRRAMFSITSLKAFGVDGFQASFFNLSGIYWGRLTVVL